VIDLTKSIDWVMPVDLIARNFGDEASVPAAVRKD